MQRKQRCRHENTPSSPVRQTNTVERRLPVTSFSTSKKAGRGRREERMRKAEFDLFFIWKLYFFFISGGILERHPGVESSRMAVCLQNSIHALPCCECCVIHRSMVTAWYMSTRKCCSFGFFFLLLFLNRCVKTALQSSKSKKNLPGKTKKNLLWVNVFFHFLGLFVLFFLG